MMTKASRSTRWLSTLLAIGLIAALAGCGQPGDETPTHSDVMTSSAAPGGQNGPIQKDGCASAAMGYGRTQDQCLEGFNGGGGGIDDMEPGSGEWCDAVGEMLDKLEPFVLVIERCETHGEGMFEGVVNDFYEWFELWWSLC